MKKKDWRDFRLPSQARLAHHPDARSLDEPYSLGALSPHHSDTIFFR